MSINFTLLGQGIAFTLYVAIFFYLFYRMATNRGLHKVECVACGFAGCIPGFNLILFAILLLIRARSPRATVR